MVLSSATQNLWQEIVGSELAVIRPERPFALYSPSGIGLFCTSTLIWLTPVRNYSIAAAGRFSNLLLAKPPQSGSVRTSDAPRRQS
jgi:hypothetical protein